MIATNPQLTEIVPYTLPHRPSGALRLDLNENRYGVSPAVIQALASMPREAYTDYPDPAPFLNRLARQLLVPSACLLPCAGADDGLRAIFQAFLRPGDMMIVPQPAYGMYTPLIRLAGAHICPIPFRDDFSVPIQAWRAALQTEVRGLVLNSPHNPLGIQIPQDLVHSLLVEFPDKLFVMDETYVFFNGPSYTAWVDRFPNLVVVGSLSKTHGLAGMRIGWVAAGTLGLKALQKTLLPFPVASAALCAGCAALDDREWIAMVRKATQAGARQLDVGLRRLGVEIRRGGANFILIRPPLDGERVRSELAQRQILVRSLRGQALLDEWLRVTVGTSAENDRLLGAIRDILSSSTTQEEGWTIYSGVGSPSESAQEYT